MRRVISIRTSRFFVRHWMLCILLYMMGQSICVPIYCRVINCTVSIYLFVAHFYDTFMHHDRFRFQTIFTMLYCNVLKITTARVHRPTLPSFSGSSPSPSIRGTLSNDFQLQTHHFSELPTLASVHLSPAPTSSPNIHLPNSFPVLQSSKPTVPNLVARELF